MQVESMKEARQQVAEAAVITVVLGWTRADAAIMERWRSRCFRVREGWCWERWSLVTCGWRFWERCRLCSGAWPRPAKDMAEEKTMASAGVTAHTEGLDKQKRQQGQELREGQQHNWRQQQRAVAQLEAARQQHNWRQQQRAVA